VSGYGAFDTVPPAIFPHAPNPTYAQSEVRAACAPDRRCPVGRVRRISRCRGGTIWDWTRPNPTSWLTT